MPKRFWRINVCYLLIQSSTYACQRVRNVSENSLVELLKITGDLGDVTSKKLDKSVENITDGKKHVNMKNQPIIHL